MVPSIYPDSPEDIFGETAALASGAILNICEDREHKLWRDSEPVYRVTVHCSMEKSDELRRFLVHHPNVSMIVPSSPKPGHIVFRFIFQINLAPYRDSSSLWAHRADAIFEVWQEFKESLKQIFGPVLSESKNKPLAACSDILN